MLVYAIILCALVAITYLIQFQAFSHYYDRDLDADLHQLRGLPKENIFEYELTEVEQLSGV
jgi:hypothetical protein